MSLATRENASILAVPSQFVRSIPQTSHVHVAISFSIPNFSHWREISGSMKTAEGLWNSSGLLQVTVLQEDGTRSSLKDDRGLWNGMVTMSCHPLCFGKCKVCPSWHLCLDSVGLCCHLVSPSGNDISVQVGRKSV